MLLNIALEMLKP